MGTTTRVVIGVSVDVDEWWSTVFGSSFETWSWWKEVEYLDGSNWDTAGAEGSGQVRLVIEDPNSDGVIEKTIGVPELVAAWNRAIVECHTLDGRPFNHEDLDAADADAILQIAVLGEVEFS